MIKTIDSPHGSHQLNDPHASIRPDEQLDVRRHPSQQHAPLLLLLLVIIIIINIIIIYILYIYIYISIIIFILVSYHRR